jgi:hypothetical protein
MHKVDRYHNYIQTELESRTTDAVRPAALLPLPLVYTYINACILNGIFMCNCTVNCVYCAL